MLPGHGIGPEISAAVEKVFSAAKVPIDFEHHVIHEKAITPGGDLISDHTL